MDNTTDLTAQKIDTDDEISLIDLFAVLLHYKVMIITVTLLAVVFIVTFSIVSLKLPTEKSFYPNKYTSSATMKINDDSSSSSGLSSMLGSSALSSLVGISGSSGSSNASLAQYLITSKTFLDSIIDQYNLIEKWKIEKSPKTTSRKILREKLTASVNDDSGLFTISMTDIDPVFAKSVVNSAVAYLEEMFDSLGVDQNKITKENLEKNIEASYNQILDLQEQTKKLESSVSSTANAWNMPSIITGTAKIAMDLTAQKEVYTQLKTQYELLKVQMASESPVFQILEMPEIPDMKSGPSRGRLCIIVTFAAFFMSVFLAFLLHAIKNIKNDKDAMQKLKLN